MLFHCYSLIQTLVITDSIVLLRVLTDSSQTASSYHLMLLRVIELVSDRLDEIEALVKDLAEKVKALSEHVDNLTARLIEFEDFFEEKTKHRAQGVQPQVPRGATKK